MQWIIEQVVYDTKKATILASNSKDTPSVTFKPVELYRTPKGKFFKFEESEFEPPITPLSLDKAIEEYNKLSDKIVGYEKAFPGVDFKDA